MATNSEELRRGEEPTIVAEIDAKLVELSGLGLRTLGGKLEILAVGDGHRKIASADASEATPSFVVHDSLPSAEAESQWEAITGDATGRVFVLEESPGAVYVLDPEITSEEAKITLTLDGSEWEKGNSRGEGLVLLKNGHILLLKEKSPTLLVELGPLGEEASGYAPGSAVSANDVFPVPRSNERTYVILKEWAIGDSAAKVAPDASDLAVGPDGLLYVLSDKGRSISVIAASVGPSDECFELDATWRLPKAIAKPEGLAILPDGRVYVASDGPGRGQKRLFLLSKLSRAVL